MIIWSGHGYLVAVFVFGASFLMEYTTEAVFKDENFYQREVYGPRVRALRSEAGEEAGDLFREFERGTCGARGFAVRSAAQQR